MLRDVMAGSGLAVFAEVGLLIFLTVFLLICTRILLRGKGHYEELSKLPLREDADPSGQTEPADDAGMAHRSAS
jgi:hypothetical protein